MFIGIDWVDPKHDIYVMNRNGQGFHRELEHSPENIDAWVGEMLTLSDRPPHHRLVASERFMEPFVKGCDFRGMRDSALRIRWRDVEADQLALGPKVDGTFVDGDAAVGPRTSGRIR